MDAGGTTELENPATRIGLYVIILYKFKNVNSNLTETEIMHLNQISQYWITLNLSTPRQTTKIKRITVSKTALRHFCISYFKHYNRPFPIY